MVQPHIEGIAEQLLVVRADVQHDREALHGVDASGGGVQGELADRDRHPVGPEIAEAEDALAVGYDNDFGLVELRVDEAEHQFAFGDVIRLSTPGQTSGITGTVEELTLRVTKLRDQAGVLHAIPNGEMRKVSWPTQEEVKDMTVVVLTVSGILALFTFTVDWVINTVMGKLL